MNISFEQYKKIKAINASFLKACSFGPYQGWKHLHEPVYETDAMRFGSAVHTALLEPHLLEKNYAFSEKFDRRTKAGKEKAEAFAAENSGKIILELSDLDRLKKIHARCMDIAAVREALTTFEKEKTYIWDGFKARLDLVDEKNGVIIDLKTTKDASKREFTKQIYDLGYNIQFLHYSKALQKPCTFYVIAVESETTEVALYHVTKIIYSDYTEVQYQMALETAKEVLLMSTCPPKFKQEIVDLTPLKWATLEAV